MQEINWTLTVEIFRRIQRIQSDASMLTGSRLAKIAQTKSPALNVNQIIAITVYVTLIVQIPTADINKV